MYESDRATHRLVNQAILVLGCNGPSEGRPLVDSITALRRRTEIRILFVFDPWRSAVLLVAGDKSGQWNRWYSDGDSRGGAALCPPFEGAAGEMGDELEVAWAAVGASPVSVEEWGAWLTGVVGVCGSLTRG